MNLNEALALYLYQQGLMPVVRDHDLVNAAWRVIMANAEETMQRLKSQKVE